MTAGTIVAPSSVPPASAAVCADILFVGARGSSQDFALGEQLDDVVSGVREALADPVAPARSLQVRALEYAARPVSDLATGSGQDRYLASMTDGADALVSLLEEEVQDCPGQALVLAGYSQGAMVVQRALAQLSTKPGVLDRVAGIGLVASGDRERGWIAREEGGSRSGVGIWRGGLGVDSPDLPSALRGRAVSLCENWDAVCDVQRYRDFRVEDLLDPDAARGMDIHTGSYQHGAGARLGRELGKLALGAAYPVEDLHRTYVNEPASLQLEARAPFAVRSAVRWRLDSGRLPAGLTLEPTGVLTGTPTETGRFPLQVSAQGGTRGLWIQATVFLYVDERQAPPPVPEPGSGPVRLSVTADGEPSSIPSYSAATSDDGRVTVHLTSDPSFGGSGLVAVLTDPFTGTRTALPTPEITQVPTGVAVSGDGTTVALVGDNGTQLTDTGTLATTWTDLGAGSSFAELSADGGLLALQSWPGVAVYDREAGHVVATASPPADQGVSYLIPMAFSADGSWLHVVDPTWQRTWRFDTATGGLTEIPPVVADTRSIRYSDDGRLAAGVDADGTVLVQEIATGSVEQATVPGITRGPVPVWVSNDGQRFLSLRAREATFNDYNNSSLHLFDRATGQETFIDNADSQVAPSPAGDLAFATYGHGVFDGVYSQLTMYWAPLD